MVISKRIAFVLCGMALHLIGCPSEKKAEPPRVEQQQPPPQPNVAVPKDEVKPGDSEEGKRLYLTGCANCHGMDGSGSMMRQMLPNIGDLTSPETHKRLSDEDIAQRIAKGKDKMPPFEGVFKPDQIKLIVAYVRTLKKGG